MSLSGAESENNNIKAIKCIIAGEMDTNVWI